MTGTPNTMNTNPPCYERICVVGAGAIGGWLAAALSRAGRRVSLLARGQTLTALQSRGLQLQTGPADAPQMHGFDVKASADAASLGVQDLVIVAVKAPALKAVAQQIGPLIGPQTVVLTAMNGVPWWFLHGFGGALQDQALETVDPGGTIAMAIGARQVIGGVVHASCSVAAPGVIRHGFGNKIIVGEPSGERSERVLALAALLQAGGLEAPVSEQIQRDIWFKLWGNMTMNPVSAFTGALSSDIMDDELVLAFCSRAMREARAIGIGFGVAIDQEPADRHAVTRKLGAFKTSMLQDVEAGKAVELDALVASVRELGQLTGVPTPEIDTLLGLARLHARMHGLY
jgi:2-dehydropantoate 2-reductase